MTTRQQVSLGPEDFPRASAPQILWERAGLLLALLVL